MNIGNVVPLKMLFGLINVVQAQSYTRDGMKYLGVVLVSHGLMVDAALWEAFIGLVVAGVGTLWSQMAARQKSVVALAGTVVPIDPAAQRAAGVHPADISQPSL